MIRVLILSHSPAVRAGLRALLSTDEEITAVEDRPLSPEARGVGFSGTPDVVLIDSEGASSETLGELVEELPEAGAVLLGAADGPWEGWVDELRGRAWALLRRDADGREIAAAVRAVAARLVVLDAALAGQIVLRPAAGGAAADSPTGGELSPPGERGAAARG